MSCPGPCCSPPPDVGSAVVLRRSKKFHVVPRLAADADTAGRDGLALDLMETCRPAVERYVLGLVATHRFRKVDFVERSDGHVRLTETVTTLNGKKKVKTKTTVQATIPLTIT